MQEGGKPRFTPGDLNAHLLPLFENLFLAFQKPESGENEYIMKCVVRVITFVGPEVQHLSIHLCMSPLYDCMCSSWALKKPGHFDFSLLISRMCIALKQKLCHAMEVSWRSL